MEVVKMPCYLNCYCQLRSDEVSKLEERSNLKWKRIEWTAAKQETFTFHLKYRSIRINRTAIGSCQAQGSEIGRKLFMLLKKWLLLRWQFKTILCYESFQNILINIETTTLYMTTVDSLLKTKTLAKRVFRNLCP